MLAEIGGARAVGRLRERVWWLISRRKRGQTESMTFLLGGRETLAVFSYEEEAGMFLWSLGAVGDGWSVRESRCGEVVSVLCGPCAGVKAVALDPLPEMAADGTAELVCQDRDDFLRRLLQGAGPPIRGFGNRPAGRRR